jgi:hypothetical protein
MSGLSSWSNVDIAAWRNELEVASKGSRTSREKAIALCSAALSYVAGSAWITVVKDLGCPPAPDSVITAGALCQEMTTVEMIIFFVYAILATVAVVIIVFGLYSCRAKLDATFGQQRQLQGAVLLTQHKTFDLVSVAVGESVIKCRSQSERGQIYIRL